MYKRPYDHPMWRALRLKVFDRDGWVCRVQGPTCTIDAEDCDHIIPWDSGGSWFGFHEQIEHPDNNLRAACRACNSRRAMRVMKRPSPSREW